MPPSPARKRFGQNFLHDAGVIRRIVDSLAVEASDHFVEIGPGHGAITQNLAAKARRLDVVEIDRDLAAELGTQNWPGDMHIHQCDALQFDFGQIAAGERSLRLVGNLPYNISTPLLFHILGQLNLFRDLHVMLQKEVVARMAAAPGGRDYGRLSVALQAHCAVESLFRIGPGAFRPAPKVESAFARLVPLTEPHITGEEQPLFDTIVRSAFGQRRKQLSNALSGVVTVDTIRAADIDPKSRAETLSVEDYAELARRQLRNSR